MGTVPEDDIVDRIYDASVIPDPCVDILDQIAPIAEWDGGVLLSVDHQQTVCAITSACYGSLLEAYVKKNWASRNIRARRLTNMNYPGFVVDYDVVMPNEVVSAPFYKFLRAYGGGWGAGTIVPVPIGDLIMFNVERWGEKGPLDRSVLAKLDQLRPHLARSAPISVRLGLERARATSETLSQLNLPGAVRRANGTVLSTNALLEKMRKQFVSAPGERLAIINQGSHELFQAADVSSARKPSQLHCQSIPVSAVDDDPACVAHLLPARRQAQDIFNGASILLLVTALGKPKALSAHVLHGLFDLTAAEAKVACSLTDGSGIETIASASSLSRETIRNQLKSVLTKTGTKRAGRTYWTSHRSQNRSQPFDTKDILWAGEHGQSRWW